LTENEQSDSPNILMCGFECRTNG